MAAKLWNVVLLYLSGQWKKLTDNLYSHDFDVFFPSIFSEIR